MKLWQKVFLVSLVFIVLAVDMTAVMVVQINFSTIINREKQQAITKQEYIEKILSSSIVNKRLNGDAYHVQEKPLFLTQEQVESTLRNIELKPYNIDNSDIMILNDQDEVIRGESLNILKQESKFVETVKNQQNYSSLIEEYNHKSYLITGSSLNLESKNYQLYTIIDISLLYEQYYNQHLLIQGVAFIFASVLSIILLMITLKLLNPLKTLNQSILKIAHGQYYLRLPEKGTVEFKELASNINIMAESIERDANKIQELADNRKEFIHYLAHEMKTPLTSVLGFADILRVKKDVNEKERREYSNIIFKEAKRLQSLSTKLLELVTTDQTVLELENISIKELFEDVQKSISPILDKNHITLFVNYEDVSLCVDKTLFKSLLYNLVDNAMKASKEGQEILLEAHQKKDIIEIKVCDQGIGMSQDQIEKVVEPFYMVDKSRSRQSGGAGLGLALCVEIVKVHGAELLIESELGKGTCVIIRMKGESVIENV